MEDEKQVESKRLENKAFRNATRTREKNKQKVHYSSTFSLNESCKTVGHYKSIIVDSFRLSTM